MFRFLERRQALITVKRLRRRMKGILFTPGRISRRTWHETRQRTGMPACQLSIKTRNRVGKRVEGSGLKRIERIHHPYFTETTFDIPPPPLSLSLYASSSRRFIVPPSESLSLPRTLVSFLSISPLATLFPRIRSSPSISRPLLFLLSICALSGRFEAR